MAERWGVARISDSRDKEVEQETALTPRWEGPEHFYHRSCPGYWRECLAGCPDADLGSLSFCRRFRWEPGLMAAARGQDRKESSRFTASSS